MSTVIQILECLGPEMYALGGHEKRSISVGMLVQWLQGKDLPGRNLATWNVTCMLV